MNLADGKAAPADEWSVRTDAWRRTSGFEHFPFLSDECGKTGIARFLNWELRLKIALDAAQGLDYLHTGCMMVHRDVKSSNILLDQNLNAKLADFGLAKIFGGDAQMSLTSTISGTPGYIDPEYVQN
ncbi:hypothetical protein E2562_022716 [Oryza meyeriana var. granulata]|uniref:non-specific serine/threonine protein kinase n=1 Tax=Oryza meyeriana var. granulata TaxID=110450 RepID=A0A6G1E043_9ORYZ|nr:hypothetical protein E2562_022716 [Oryza meyeriana var. granulata]